MAARLRSRGPGITILHTDPRFDVKKSPVAGLKHVDENEVLAASSSNTGINTNIFAVDMDDVRDRVEEIEWVRYAHRPARSAG